MKKNRNKENLEVFKGMKGIKEVKLNDTRMLVRIGKNGKPAEILAYSDKAKQTPLTTRLVNLYDS